MGAHRCKKCDKYYIEVSKETLMTLDCLIAGRSIREHNREIDHDEFLMDLLSDYMESQIGKTE